MTPWRWFVLALCALAIGLTVNEVFVPTGDTGTSPDPQFVRLLVAPGSAAYAMGLRTGDRLDFRALTPLQRYSAFNSIDAIGQRVTYRVIDANGVSKTVVVVARASQRSVAGYALAIAGHLWFLAFALLIAWRRPGDLRARALTILLLAQVLTTGFGNFATPWPAVNFINSILTYAMFAFSTALLATYASLFARPIGRVRAALTTLSYLLAAAAPLYVLGGVFFADAPLYTLSVLSEIMGAVSLVSVLCSILALAAARGDERQRLAWSALPLGAFFIGSSLIFALQPSASTAFYGILEFVTPLLLTYALLSRRVLDFGFAINRAAVFSGVSVVLVGAFVLAEWIFGEWLKDASHTTNIIVAAALALILGLSIRAVHARVEDFLDKVFFRKRYENERALLDFAQEAPYVTDSGVLIARTANLVERHTGASFVTLALSDDNGSFGGISENDRAFVALRARNTALDLHTVETEVKGEFAYPMVARGRLVGALIVGPKRSHESYAPDESEAISDVARSVGGALDALHYSGNGSRDAFLERLELLTERMEALSARLTT